MRRIWRQNQVRDHLCIAHSADLRLKELPADPLLPRPALIFRQLHPIQLAFAFICSVINKIQLTESDVKKHKYSVHFFTLLLLSGCAIWYASSLVTTMSSDQIDDLDHSLASATHQIGDYLEIRKKVARSFTDKNAKKLEPLASPGTTEDEIEHVNIAMQSIMKAAIPDLYSFLVRSASGDYTPDEFDENIGSLCREDMDQFLAANHAMIASGRLGNNRYLPYKPIIHPHPDHYHFDIVSPWQDSSGVIHLFNLLLDTEGISNILKTNEIPDHQLLLLRQGMPTLIEITSQGDRSQLNDNINLSIEELSRVYGRNLVPGTGWEIAYIINDPVPDSFRTKVWIATIAGICLLWIMFLIFIRMHHKDRHS